MSWVDSHSARKSTQCSVIAFEKTIFSFFRKIYKSKCPGIQRGLQHIHKSLIMKDINYNYNYRQVISTGFIVNLATYNDVLFDCGRIKVKRNVKRFPSRMVSN